MLSSNGRHRVLKATPAQRFLAGAGVLGLGLALPLAAATSASAAVPTHSSEPASLAAVSGLAAPAAPVTTTTPAATGTATAAEYTVRAGDTLSGIAQSKAVSGGWEQLFKLNSAQLPEGAGMIYPGQSLVLGGTVSAAASSSASSSSTSVATKSVATTTTASTSSATKASTSSATGLAAAVAFAEAQVGDSYVYGAEGPSSWDCSGLTQAALAKAGISLPRVAADQAAATTHVALSDLQPGDLLFWSSNGSDSGVYHVGIYAGGGKYVEAANPSVGVHWETISNWAPDFAGRIG